MKKRVSYGSRTVAVEIPETREEWRRLVHGNLRGNEAATGQETQALREKIFLAGVEAGLRAIAVSHGARREAILQGDDPDKLP